jgi:RHS repeat-associated protein
MGFCAGGDTNRTKFTGYERDTETGLDFTQARYFSSAQGRFTSPDTLLGSLANPQTLNRYAYVGNNPLNSSDPTGHLAVSATGPAPGSWVGFEGPEAGDLPERYEQEIARIKEVIAEDESSPAPEHESDNGHDTSRAASDLGEHSGANQAASDPGEHSGANDGAPEADPGHPQQTSEAQQQPQSQDATWKDQLKGDIKFEGFMIAGYRRYAPAARTVDELESKVNAYVRRRCHCEIEVAGTTTSSGQMDVRPDPNPYRREATRRHEEVHHDTALRGHERFGYGARFDRWWLNPRRWAADEIKAYSTDIRRLRELEEENRRLKQISADLLLENRALKDVIARKL